MWRWLISVSATATLVALCPGLASARTDTSWSIEPVPLPAGVTNGSFAGVSCVSAANCFAAGEYNGAHGGLIVPLAMINHWNGSTWADQNIPLPPDTSQSELNGVSCVSMSSCVAVGWYSATNTSVTPPLAESWNGSAWTVDTTVQASESSTLNAVDCTSADNCTAVGGYWTGVTELPLAEKWDGSTWTLQGDPSQVAGQDYLTGVSCSSADHCIAVGLADGRTANVQQWNGSSWVLDTVPVPPGAEGVALLSVACPSATECTAVGGYDHGPGTRGLPLVEHLDGSTWTAVTPPLPHPPSRTPTLLGVSCVSARHCIAVGQSILAPTALAEAWNGRHWKVQPTGLGPGALKMLYAVSCVTVTSCAAVGSVAGGRGYQVPLAEQRSKPTR